MRGSIGNRTVGFMFDLGRCTGCGACVLACRLENDGRSAAPPFRRVLTLNERRRAGGPTWFLSLACHHCERPVCLRVCPTGAYEQRPGGMVAHDDALCIGCRYCEMACPFGALQFDAARGVVAKCDFCRSRVTRGEPPACVAACPTEALRVDSARLKPRPTDEESGVRPAGHDAPESSAETATSPVGQGFSLAEPGFSLAEIPGFSDPADCRPAIRFKLPRGVRGERLQRLLANRERERP